MDNSTAYMITFLAGGLLGIISARLWSARKTAVLEERAMTAERLTQELKVLQKDHSDLLVKYERMQATSEAENKAAEEKIKLLSQARADLTKDFENLANRIFEDKTKAGQHSLKDILDPFKHQIQDFKQRVERIYDTENQQRATLLNQIQELKQLNNDIGKEAKGLATALKGESKTRGNWGEMILERILESSGLQKGREYDTQLFLKDRFGGTAGKYPDVVVHLPEDRDVVIDSKMVLHAYEQYCGTEDEQTRAALLKKHIAAVRTHMDDLASKKYQDLDGINALDQVIMCIPTEPAYITAVAEDPQLHEDALKKQILLVGPNTLVLTLKIIKTMWRHEDQARNAADIADRGQKLYEKFAGFVEDIETLGKALGRADAAFQEAKKKLHTGNDNLVRQSQKLIDLGIKTRKKLPDEYARLAETDEETVQSSLPQASEEK